jgi:hypothetical protein
MSLAQQLSQLRPLMTEADMNAVLGAEETKRALDVLSNPQRTTGVYVFFSRSEDVIDSLLYTASFNFPRDVAVCGVCIGMTVDAMREALPEVRLADGETGEPNEHGVVQYRAQPTSLNATLGIGVKNGEVAGISLRRLDMDEVLARRERQEAERKAARDRELDRASRWKSIADPDKMLLDWAKHCSPWTDYSPQRFVAFARWLMATPDPDVWHIAATRWNWDYDHAVPLWIIRQKNCDIATALEVFFLAEPSYYFRWVNDRSSIPAGREQEGFDFLAEIRERLARGFYKRSEIAFDGERHMSYINQGLKTAEDKALAQNFFPPQAGRKIRGRDPIESDSAAAGECYAILATVN